MAGSARNPPMALSIHAAFNDPTSEPVVGSVSIAPVSGMKIVEPGRSLNYALPAAHRAFGYALSGTVQVAGRPTVAGQIAWSDPVPRASASSLRLRAGDGDEPAVVLIYSGRPTAEPIVMGGPFVMNSKTEIALAFQDFHGGGFGQVPRQARLKHR